MSYKKVVIEDNKGNKYYPVTSVKNIPDIKEVSEYVNINDIEIDNSTSEKLGDTIVNIKNELKDHKHSANDINETYSRKFVTSSQITNINKIAEINKEVDSLKQSGVESNKILVDALNSKGVWASTSGSIKTNVNKVKNIKVGDYSIGDILSLDNIKIIHDNKNPYIINSLNHDKGIKRLIRDDSGYIYIGDVEGNIVKISNNKKIVWSINPYNKHIVSLHIDDNGYLYVGDTGGRVFKISSSGTKVKDYNTYDDWVRSITTDKDGYIYIASNKHIYKLSSSGSKIWELNLDKSVLDVVTDNNYVYVAANNKFFKLTKTGSKILEKEFKYLSLEKIRIDSKKNIYIAGYELGISKLSPDGNIIWRINDKQNNMFTGMAIGYDDHLYTSSHDNMVMKTSPNGDIRWIYQHEYYTQGVAVDEFDYVYSCDNKGAIFKISPGQIKNIKIFS